MINPALLHAQVHGALYMGMGESIWEEVRFDANGKIQNPNLGEYRLPTALDMPRIHSSLVPSYEPAGPWGVKEVGEGATLPTMGCFRNAIFDAMGVLGEQPAALVREGVARAAREGRGRRAGAPTDGLMRAHPDAPATILATPHSRPTGVTSPVTTTRGRIHYAWYILVMGVLVVACVLGLARFGYTVILPSMQKSLGLSNTQAGTLATANLLGYACFALVGGALASHYGPRRVVTAGLLIIGGGMLLTGLAHGFVSAAALRLLTGVGFGPGQRPGDGARGRLVLGPPAGSRARGASRPAPRWASSSWARWCPASWPSAPRGGATPGTRTARPRSSRP